MVRTLAVAAAAAALIAPAAAMAQELEPRSYSPAPVGSTFLVVAVGNSTGDILFDTASPITDVKANVSTSALGFAHVFDLAGHQANISVAVPYAWGEISGNVGNTAREVERSGLADARVRLSTLLIGGPALTPSEFAARKPGPIVGVSLLAVVPTGQYAGQRLVNIGNNRWAAKPEIGVSYPFGHWQADAYAGVWLFGKNDDYLGGGERSQAPLGSFQAHLSYTVRPRLWAALDATWFTGGETTVNGGTGADRQGNLRVGVSISAPLAKRQSLQFGYNRGAVTRVGGNFDTFTLSFQTLLP